MFFSTDVLDRKAPIGIVWNAGTSGRLRPSTKSDVEGLNVIEFIQSHLIKPAPTAKPFALRTQAQLLSGVCVIYNRKVKLFEAAASKFQARLRLVFGTTRQGGNVDLPKDRRVAKAENITLIDDALNELMMNELLFTTQGSFMVSGLMMDADELVSPETSRLGTSGRITADYGDITLNQNLLNLQEFDDDGTNLLQPDGGVLPFPEDDLPLPPPQEDVDSIMPEIDGEFSMLPIDGDDALGLPEATVLGLGVPEPVELPGSPPETPLPDQLEPEPPVKVDLNKGADPPTESKKRKRSAGRRRSRKSSAVNADDEPTEISFEEMRHNLEPENKVWEKWSIQRRVFGDEPKSAEDLWNEPPDFLIMINPATKEYNRRFLEWRANKIRESARADYTELDEESVDSLLSQESRAKRRRGPSPTGAEDELGEPAPGTVGVDFEVELPLMDDLEQPLTPVPFPGLDETEGGLPGLPSPTEPSGDVDSIQEPETLRAVFEANSQLLSEMRDREMSPGLQPQQGTPRSTSSSKQSLPTATGQAPVVQFDMTPRSRTTAMEGGDDVTLPTFDFDQDGLAVAALTEASSAELTEASSHLSQFQLAQTYSTTEEETANRRESFTKNVDVRTWQFQRFLKLQFRNVGTGKLSLEELFEGGNKRDVSKAFFQVLVLSSNQYVDVEQLTPFGDVELTDMIPSSDDSSSVASSKQ